MSEDFYKKYIEPYNLMIYKICRAYATDAELPDYYQEVCLQLWKSHDNFQNKSSYSTWVYRLTLNVCLTIFRKKKKLKKAEEESLRVLGNEYENSEESENLRQLYTKIKKLHPIDRAIILLYLENKKHNEIAEILGLSSSNIGTRIYRIKSKLKDQLHAK